MNFQDFAYWLQGYNEISGGKAPSAKQWRTIQDHLQLVFHKVTPHSDTPHRGGCDLPVLPTRIPFGPFPAIKPNLEDTKYCNASRVEEVLHAGTRLCGDTRITYNPLELHSQPTASC